ncbi:MAG: hypothetical protein AAGG01_14880, partial [Planctomycetota bacterium]
VTQSGVRTTEIYASYRRIQRDESMSAAQKRERTQELRSALSALAESVRSGQVPAGSESDPLFPLVLAHVFPPATSTSPDRYLSLYRRFSHGRFLRAGPRDASDARRPSATSSAASSVARAWTRPSMPIRPRT